MMRALALLLMSTSTCFAAEVGWPALYDVTGVAADDALNIRSAPNAGSAAVGALAPDATDIEAVSTSPDGKWVQISTPNGTGWAALAYLVRQPGQTDDALPEFTECFGTEPFWSLERGPDGTLQFSTPEERRAPLPVDWSATPASHRHRMAFVAGTMVGTVAREMCSDGMSDRLFGLEVTLTDIDRRQVWWGCCTIAPVR